MAQKGLNRRFSNRLRSSKEMAAPEGENWTWCILWNEDYYIWRLHCTTVGELFCTCSLSSLFPYSSRMTQYCYFLLNQDTLKRAVKAGDGTILATSPPYTHFLNSGVDFAVVDETMPCYDMWVREFLRCEIPCILADYFVAYVCKPGYPCDSYVQYNTHTWVKRSLKNLANRLEEVVDMVPSDDNNKMKC